MLLFPKHNASMFSIYNIWSQDSVIIIGACCRLHESNMHLRFFGLEKKSKVTWHDENNKEFHRHSFLYWKVTYSLTFDDMLWTVNLFDTEFWHTLYMKWMPCHVIFLKWLWCSWLTCEYFDVEYKFYTILALFRWKTNNLIQRLVLIWLDNLAS